MINYYKILEIPDFSDERAIKKAYRTLSKKYHPDVNPSQQAQDYFIVIKEAYEYLSDPKNKGYLDEVLVRQRQIKNQAQQPITPPNSTYWQPPRIHYFKSNTSYYSLDDIVVIEWSVEGAKSVEIDYLGKVNASGRHGLKLKRFEEELEVNMRVTGFDAQYYYRKLVFKYRDKNPNVEAWRQQRKIDPNVRQEHFKKENLFWMYGRIAVETFRHRLYFATLFFALVLWISYWQNWTSISVISSLVYSAFILVNLTKRLHDLGHNWTSFFRLHPSNLLHRQGSRQTNSYGPYRPPKYTDIFDLFDQLWIDFKQWTFSAKLAFSITLLSVVWSFHSYLQPVVQIDPIHQVQLGIIENKHWLIFNDEARVAIDAQLYYQLREGIYSDMEVYQFLFTNEITTIELWTWNGEQRTVYFGFVGNRPVLTFILLFLLVFEWQLIQGYGRINNQEQLSGLMWGIVIILLMAWKMF